MTKDYSHLIGETFGDLTIFDISEPDTKHGSRRMAECLCSCGKSCSINLQSILNGSSKTCGHTRELPKSHMDYKLFIGKRFGKLVIVDVLYDANGKRNHKVQAVCQCDCGKKFETNFYTVKNGYKTSCGCEHETISRDKLRQEGVDVTNIDQQSTGIRNIHRDHKGYHVQIQRNGVLVRKSVRSLEEAIKVKEQILNDLEKQGLTTSANQKPLSDLIGRTFNHLTILEIGEPDHNRNRMRFAKCYCDCGKITETRLSKVVSGNIRSCGHLRGKCYPKKKKVEPPYFSSTGAKNISKRRNGKYRVEVRRNGIRKCKYVDTFEEALEVKQQFLKQFGEK